MKTIIIAAALTVYTSTIHLQPGKYDAAKNRWGGYLPQCDLQCQNKGGEICGTTFHQCCQSQKC